MTCASSMQWSPGSKIYGNFGCCNVCVGVTGKERLHMVHINLSSRFMRQDAWSLHLLSGVCGPINPLSSRGNVFLCRSVLVRGGGNEIPVLKSAAVVLTKSYDTLRGNPVVLQLIPAAGIIAFAAWGIVPLVRLGRVIFLNRTDSSWKKSSTHYVLTSYLQPLVLWTGATLVCRALDPVVLPSEASQAVKQRVLNFVQSLSTVLAFAYCLSSLIQQAQKYFLETNDSDSSEARNASFFTFPMGFNFAGKAVYTAVWVAAVSLFMELLGFSTQRWLTAGGLGTVLLTLAGREIFTNFLSSVMIHATRPFIVNEWIQTKIEGYEVSGTVEHVGWWSPTIIRGDDREAVHIPNHKFTVSVVRNLSQKSHWRIKTHLAISHLDVHKVNIIVADMRKVLAKNSSSRAAKVTQKSFLGNCKPRKSGSYVMMIAFFTKVMTSIHWSIFLQILVSCFVKTSHFEEYLCVKEAILMDLLRVVSHHQARLATPIRTVQKIYSEADLENIPFADTIFSRSRAPANRPFLLIEPAYKISGEEKVKASTRPVQNEEKDAKVEAASTSGSKVDSKAGSESILESNGDKVASTAASNASTKSQSGNVVQDNSVQSKNEEELNESIGDAGKKTGKVTRPTLEENIVLGVALEGSKRTLPIDDELAASSLSAESKELAASRNGSGSPAVSKEKKDGQMPSVPRPGANQAD
ncbi:hypothetical protein Patl1_08659 [Pistacia atlantica]|uniref:Uncharacterized protein n=1 Tax=Pistacia atlantica TaxID=434234 RepID=A0ACC1AJL9_9ROSI|nr:hypothetical protein Patl1_08659 [Pistacia atlantica]